MLRFAVEVDKCVCGYAAGGGAALVERGTPSEKHSFSANKAAQPLGTRASNSFRVIALTDVRALRIDHDPSKNREIFSTIGPGSFFLWIAS